MLDNAYVLRKIKPQKDPLTKAQKNTEFSNFSREYAKRSKSNAQRVVLESKIGLEMLRNSENFAWMATTLCKTNQNMQQIQSLLLKAFPDLASPLLFAGEGKMVSREGDGIVMKTCRKIHHYTIIWDRKINKTCYHLLPVNTTVLGWRFLELETRRLLTHSHRKDCKKVPKITYVEDQSGGFWEFRLGRGFKRLTRQLRWASTKGISLPKLATFNAKLFYNQHQQAHRLTLLNLLDERQKALEELHAYEEVGGGSVTEGIITAISNTIDTVGKAGSKIISSISQGLALNTKSMGNATSRVIESSTHGVGEVLGKLGGIPNIVLFALNGLIIVYLIYIRRGQPQGRPEIIVQRMNTPTVPPRGTSQKH